MSIYWITYINTTKIPEGTKGIVIGPLAPFKGICNHCGKRKVVRHYPYNVIEPLGVYCKECFKEIDKAVSEGGIAPREDDYE